EAPPVPDRVRDAFADAVLRGEHARVFDSPGGALVVGSCEAIRELGFWLLASVLEFHHSIHAMFTFNVGEWPFAKWAVAAGILNLLFVSLGLKAWGLAGAAAGCMAAQLLTNNWYVVYFTLRRLDLGLKRYIGQALIPLAGLVMTLWLAGRAIHPALEGLAWPARLVRGLALREAGPALAGPLVLATLALLILWLLLLDREERNLIFKKKEAL
ncbi:MAG: hypothetical protein V4498_00435, partial [candidate division FCPU426 bacterium]